MRAITQARHEFLLHSRNMGRKMSEKKSLLREPIVIAIASVLYLALGIFVGANAHQAGYLRSIPMIPGSFFDSILGHHESEQRFSSIFVPLSSQSVPVPVGDRVGSGGGLTSLGESLLLLDFDGRIWLVVEGGEAKALQIETPPNGFDALEAYAASNAGEELSFDLSLLRYNDIHYEENHDGGTLFVTYTHFDEQEVCYTNRLAALAATKQQFESAVVFSAEDWKLLYESSPCLPLKSDFRAIEGHMAGGRMDFDRTRKVIVLGNGDFAIDEHYSSIGKLAAQEPGWEYGAMVEIDLASGSSRVLSRGHRNIQGVTLDPAHNAIWAVEHGMRGGDEINLVREGANFGWPLVSYGTSYSSLPLQTALEESVGRHDGFQEPSYAFLPSIAVATSDLIEGFHPTWDGDLLIGTLKTGELIRVRYDHDDGRVIFAEHLSIGMRIRDVEVMSGGLIGLWTDSRQVLFLRPAEQGLAGRYVEYRLDTSDRPESVKNEVRTVLARCSECHSLERGIHDSAPGLGNLIGRDAGTTSYTGYSAPMLGSGIRWDVDTLTEFLRNPDQSVPGTSMPRVEMTDAAREEVVSIISGLSNEVEIPERYDAN